MQTYDTSEAAGCPRQAHTGTAASSLGAGVLDQLLSELAERIADHVATRLSEPERREVDAWLDSRRAAEYLSIGRDSLRRLAAERSVPAEQAGTGCKLYFRRSDLDAWRTSADGPVEPLRGRRHG